MHKKHKILWYNGIIEKETAQGKAPVLFVCKRCDMRNTQQFIDLCQGVFGRRVAYSDYDTVTAYNVRDIISSTIGIHNQNRFLIRYLYDYYKGDQPVNYRQKKVRPEINNRVCENHALETVRFKVSQTYGEAIQYVSKSADAGINKQVDLLNDYLEDAFAKVRNIQMGTYQSAVGTAYKAVVKEDDWKPGDDGIPFGIYIPSPMDTYIVYSKRTGKRLLSVQCLKRQTGENYYLCYSKNEFFEIQNGDIVASGPNWFEDIPIVEYPNNADRLSDIEICITIFDAINSMQSNRMDGVEQFVQALMKFKNCEIDEETFSKIQKMGAVSVKDSGSGSADVEMLSSELNQEQTQVAKDDLYRQMLIIEGMPDRQQNTGGDTGQAVYLRNGWDFAEKRALLDEPFIKEAEKTFTSIVIRILKKTTQDINLSVRDFEVKITRNPTDNMLVKAQALDYLIKNKIHPLIALVTCGLFGDPQKVYELSWPYMESLYTQEEMEAEVKKANRLLQNVDQ